MDIIEAFRARVESAITAHGIAPSTFGAKALGDPRFVSDLRKKKREPKMSTIAAVDAFIAYLEKKPAPKKRKRAA
jgi:hypothetical protein